MSKRIFTKEEVVEISKNINVLRCSERSITYAKDFKINAVKLYEQGLPPIEIFIRFGFDIRIIGRKTPKEMVGRHD